MNEKEFERELSVQAKLDQIQHLQAKRIVESGVLGRMACANPRFDAKLLNDGFPIVLSSKSRDVRFIFLAIRSQNTDGELRSSMYHVGQQVDGLDLTPNWGSGVLDSDVELFNSMLDELHLFQQDFAPNYDIEYGKLQ
jgi:hypothetical protein